MTGYLTKFPTKVREELASISENGGVLNAELVKIVCNKLSISIESLMIQLLPLASSFSISPLSNFKAAAVVRGEQCGGAANLYLGANIEFPEQPLCYSLHAEQAAVSNAWLNGETSITSIATSATPCGHCRQFLYEVVGSKSFPILFYSDKLVGTAIESHKGFQRQELIELLPAAFGPIDLGCEKHLMDAHSNSLKLESSIEDELVSAAVEAANQSYAPYTSNFSGCALQLKNGDIYTGRYAENAAFNPSLLPFSAAFSKMTLATKKLDRTLQRVVLVEKKAAISHRDVTQNQLDSYANNLTLEFHPLNSDSTV